MKGDLGGEAMSLHAWVRARLVAWRSGLLTDAESQRVAEHVERCSECAALVEAFAAPDADSTHIPPSLMAHWADARRSLRGLERRLIRHHLATCEDCRQDLVLLGHAPTLEVVPELEKGAPAVADVGKRAPEPIDAAIGRWQRDAPIAPGTTRATIRVIMSPRRRDRALLAWATIATAAAVVAIVLHVRRPVVEGLPATLWAALPPPVSAPADEGLTVRLAPRPRSLKGPSRRPQGGRVTVIPVVGPVGSLALSVRPLDVPDTSMVLISLLGAKGDTLFSVRHRQWQFFPRQVLVIDGGRSPLSPGAYELELASVIASNRGAVSQRYRYPFELRPRNR